jgi:poly-gamma-glutamate capsule biosynthesis protein CapA/YwtB (metallophosphatase superfamily)
VRQDRRTFLQRWAALALGLADRTVAGRPAEGETMAKTASGGVTLFLCGDLMLGRGIDQALPHPGDPQLYEPYLRSALGYLALAERVNGPIPRPVDFAYVWGDAQEELARRRPSLRIVNLETAVTAGGDPWPRKGIHYRLHPSNAPCLRAARVDCCVLANNHVLDWGYRGLEDTRATLRGLGIATAGAGRDAAEAVAPAVLALPGGGRVLVLAFAHRSSGVPWDWAAAEHRAGVSLLPDLGESTVDRIAGQVRALRRPGDIVLASIHWGGNWGYQIPEEHRRFAQALIDRASVDLVHGHSHHPKGIEVHGGRLVLYGCGDFLNDYEGIGGNEAYRGDLSLMYFVTLDPAGRLQRLDMVPMQIRRFRLNRAAPGDARWLQEVLDREGRGLGTGVGPAKDGSLVLRW